MARYTLLDRLRYFINPDRLKNLFSARRGIRKPSIPVRDFIYDTSYYKNPNLFYTNYGINIDQLSDYYRMCDEDTQIKSSLEQLSYSITALQDSDNLEQNPIPGKKALSKRIYNYANRQYLNLPIDKIKREGLECAFKTGIAIFQKIYKNGGKPDKQTGYLEIDDLQLRNPDYFYFDYHKITGELQLWYRSKGKRQTDKEDILCSWDRFIVLWNNGSDINPYGYSEIGRIGTGWYYIGKATVNYWNRTMERKGDPVRMLKQEAVEGVPQTSKEDLEAIVEDIYEAQGVGGVEILPSDVTSYYLEANMNNSFDYQQIYDMYKNAVKQHILNATSTMENTNETGSYNQSSVHQDSMYSKVDSKALMFENFINRLIEDLVDLNFTEDAGSITRYPLYDIVLEQENKQQQKEERQLEQNKNRIFDLISVAGEYIDMKTVFEWFDLPTDTLGQGQTFSAIPNQEVNEENVIINEFKKAYNNGRNFSKVFSLLDNINNKGKEVLLND